MHSHCDVQQTAKSETSGDGTPIHWSSRIGTILTGISRAPGYPVFGTNFQILSSQIRSKALGVRHCTTPTASAIKHIYFKIHYQFLWQTNRPYYQLYTAPKAQCFIKRPQTTFYHLFVQQSGARLGYFRSGKVVDVRCPNADIAQRSLTSLSAHFMAVVRNRSCSESSRFPIGQRSRRALCARDCKYLSNHVQW